MQGGSHFRNTSIQSTTADAQDLETQIDEDGEHDDEDILNSAVGSALPKTAFETLQPPLTSKRMLEHK